MKSQHKHLSLLHYRSNQSIKNLFIDLITGIINLRINSEEKIIFSTPECNVDLKLFQQIDRYCIQPEHNARLSLEAGYLPKNTISIDRDILHDLKIVNHKRVCENWLRIYNFPYVHHRIESPTVDTSDEVENKKQQLIECMDISLDTKRPEGELILILLNRQYGGFGNLGVDQYVWSNKVVKTIREQTNRPIMVKHHPEGLDEDKYNLFKNINFGNDVYHYATEERTNIPDSIKKDFQNRNMHSTISFNTSAGLRYYILDNIPMIIDAEKSLLKQFSCGNINDIKKIQMLDKNKLLTWYCSTHWTSKQLIEGKPILELLND
jgi:hypothetical protein